MKERGTSDNLEFSQIMLNFIITDNKDMKLGLYLLHSQCRN